MRADELTILESVLLGTLQGLTEFIPISSSGHLALFKHILGVNIQNPLGFDIALHVGTLLSVFFVLRGDIVSRLRSRENVIGTAVAFSCTVPVALFLKDAAESVENNLFYLFVSFLIGGTLLLLLPRFSFNFGFLKYPFIGVMQGISAIPGISRSGTTIAASIFSGMNVKESFGFSFFLSIPTISAAILYETHKALMEDSWFGEGVEAVEILVGVFFSFVFGCVSLAALRKIVIAKRIWLFGVYMITVSAFTFAYQSFLER